MANFRLLALDLDGTTLKNNKELSQETQVWIRKAIEEGVIVIFATGRGQQNSERYRKELNLDSPMVLLNGAEIWLGPGNILERHFIRQDDFYFLHCLTRESNSWYWAYNTAEMIKKPQWTNEMFQKDWMKFGIRNDDLTVIKQLKEIIGEYGKVEVTQSASNNLEISCKGITKEYGVARVCENLGITFAEVMAIGDSMNDWRLIKKAGLGIAMANADEHIKGIADGLTDTNENNGVAKAIRTHLLKLEL